MNDVARGDNLKTVPYTMGGYTSATFDTAAQTSFIKGVTAVGNVKAEDVKIVKVRRRLAGTRSTITQADERTHCVYV